jgi:hypothetical protein
MSSSGLRKPFDSGLTVPRETLQKVAREGARIRLTPDDESGVVALVSLDDLNLLESLEDRLDAVDGVAALRELATGDDELVAWEKVKAELGL